MNNFKRHSQIMFQKPQLWTVQSAHIMASENVTSKSSTCQNLKKKKERKTFGFQ